MPVDTASLAAAAAYVHTSGCTGMNIRVQLKKRVVFKIYYQHIKYVLVITKYVVHWGPSVGSLLLFTKKG